MIERGVAWGEPAPAGEGRPVAGTDRDLAVALAASRDGELLIFEPAGPTDFGRVLGLMPGRRNEARLALTLDLLSVEGADPAVNAVVLGAHPGSLRTFDRSFGVEVEVDGQALGPRRAQSIVIANGQFVDGVDAVPRGHPGDGWMELQVYDVPRGQRRELRRRIVTGAHLPHPGILQRRARQVVVRADRGVPVTIDGEPRGAVTGLRVDLVRAAGRVVT